MARKACGRAAPAAASSPESAGSYEPKCVCRDKRLVCATVRSLHCFLSVYAVASAGLRRARSRSAYERPAAMTKVIAAETNEYVYVPVTS
jgi:hypothetical protein